MKGLTHEDAPDTGDRNRLGDVDRLQQRRDHEDRHDDFDHLGWHQSEVTGLIRISSPRAGRPPRLPARGVFCRRSLAMTRRWLAAALVVACLGCGGEKEKDKYKDF